MRAAVIVAALVLFGVIQLASMSFVRAQGTVSSLVPIAFGRAVYHALDRIAPAPFVEETLAADALSNGDLDLAQQYALRIAQGGRRDELLGEIAQARGNAVLARQYYFAAPDIERMQAAIHTLAATDAPGAYALELQFAQRLADLQTHPDAVAEAYYFAGVYADWLNWTRRSFENFRRAAQLAPLESKYLLSAATEAAFRLHDTQTGKALYEQCLAVDPGSVDCRRLLREIEGRAK